MDINELRIARKALEIAIAKVVQRELNEFEKITGITPDYIGIKMMEIQEVGKVNRFIVMEAQADIRV